MGHVLKASAVMVSLSAIVAAAIAFLPLVPKLIDKPAASAASIPAGALARPDFAAAAPVVSPHAAAAPSPTKPLVRSVAASKSAAMDVAEANRKLAAAMTKPQADDGTAADALSQIALAAGGASTQSTLGRPAGQTKALAFAQTREAGQSAEATAELIKRAKAQLIDGAASSARLLLARAARGGSAEALTLLGQSYDAAALAELGVSGVRPDAHEARKFYSQAAAAGSSDAKKRLAQLGG